jgi:hypothetical protein
MTRAGQAKALGIVNQGKGHLGAGAEADIAIYPIRTDSVDPAREYRKVVEGFQKTRFTIKRGRVVSRDGEIIVDGANATFWTNARIPEDIRVDNDPEFIRRFQEFYTVRMSNYPGIALPRGRRVMRHLMRVILEAKSENLHSIEAETIIPRNGKGLILLHMRVTRNVTRNLLDLREAPPSPRKYRSHTQRRNFEDKTCRGIYGHRQYPDKRGYRYALREFHERRNDRYIGKCGCLARA